MSRRFQRARGSTLLELMVAMAIFLVICAAMFGLLQLSQQKYSSESQMSGSFQEARLGVDQILRDVNISGYPSIGMFSNPASMVSYALSPFAWDPGYPLTLPSAPPPYCQFGVTCSPSPGPFDLIVETDFGNGNGVSWIRYQLQGTTLLRGVVPKTAGADPVAATAASGVMTPFVEHVMNNIQTISGSVFAQITAQYPTMFQSGTPPIFQYWCNTPTGTQSCSNAPAPYNTPQYVSDVDVTLIVMTPAPDMQTQSLKLMELTGRGHCGNSQY